MRSLQLPLPISLLPQAALAILQLIMPVLALAAAIIAIGSVVGTFTGLYLAEVARLAPAADVGDATASVAAFAFTAYWLVPPLAGLAFSRFGGVATLRGVVAASLAAFCLLTWRDRSAAPALAKDQ